MQFHRASDHSLLITCGDRIHPAVHERVLHLARGLCVPGVLNVHPGYTSVLVSFDPLAATHQHLEQLARAIELEPEDPAPARVIEIPVCYGGDLGPDLDDVAEWCGFDTGKVIALHSTAEYLVYFLGFSPGFPYLGGLPPTLAMPRLPEPRLSVPAGSVAIGGEQTGVYPVASPGGWRIIGRTPLRLFDPAAEPPTLLEPGDRVRFRPIERSEFARLSRG